MVFRAFVNARGSSIPNSYLRRALDLYDNDHSGHFYDINQLTAMHLPDEAWQAHVTSYTITKCFGHARLLSSRDPITGKPRQPPAIPSSSEKCTPDRDIQAAATMLQQNVQECVDAQILSNNKTLALCTIVSPEGENEDIQAWFTDEELVQSEREEAVGRSKAEATSS